MRPRVVLVVCGVIALAVSAYAVLAPSGLPLLRELEGERAGLTADVDKARAENERLGREVKILQGGEPESDAVLEKAAREELGWTKPDEIVLTGLPVKAPTAAAQGAP
jgi:cell division protein FtsB